MVQKFPSLELSDVYQVIGYYLKYRTELGEYLKKRELEEDNLVGRSFGVVPCRAARASDGPPENSVKWLADENFDNDILRGIRRRVAGFDVVRAQDVAEISGLDDPAVLAWAATNDRIVPTHDLSTMIPAMQEQVTNYLCAAILAFTSSNQWDTTTIEGRAALSPVAPSLSIRKRLPSVEMSNGLLFG
jgi:hypothetical protein